MSQQQLSQAIEQELEKLNARIDLKIIRGQSYVREARRHRFLLKQTHWLRQRAQARARLAATPSFFTRFSRAMATLVF